MVENSNGSLERRIERLEDEVSEVTNKLFERITALEIRMAFYIGGAAVLGFLFSRAWGK